MPTIQTTSDPSGARQPGFLKRTAAWFTRNRWLLAGSLFVLISISSAAEEAETVAMQEHRRQIEQMSRTERERVRHNHEEFRKLTKRQVIHVREMHRKIQDDPELDATLIAFHGWLATLSFEQREEILATTDPTARMELVRSLRGSESNAPVRPGSTSFPEIPWLRPSKPFMRLTSTSFENVMKVVARYCKLSEEPEEKSPRGLFVHHVNVLDELLYVIRDEADGVRRENGTRPRVLLDDRLRRDMIDAVSEEFMRVRMAGRPEREQQMALMSLLQAGLQSEFVRVISSSRPDAAELQLFKRGLDATTRKELGRLPADQAERRLEWLWHRHQMPEVAKRLERIFNLLNRAQANRFDPGQRRRNGTENGP